MTVQLTDFIAVYKMPSGRVSYAMRHVLEVARASDEQTLVGLVEATLAAAASCRGLELRHRRTPKAPLHGAGALKADAELDRGWSRFASILQSTAELFGAADPKGSAAARLHDRLFPRGVAAITSQSFVEEFESSKLLVQRLASGDLAPEVTLLGQRETVERLAILTKELGKELAALVEDHVPSWDEVRAARATMQHALVRFVARVCGSYIDDDEQSASKRHALLAPLAEQQRRLAERYRARFGTVDVDPETGVEQDPSVEDLEASGQSGADVLE